MQTITHVLETCLYATDLQAMETFYHELLGLSVHRKVKDRFVFFRLKNQMLLIFNPDYTEHQTECVNGALVPPHGARGAGHVAFAMPDASLEAWKRRLATHGVVIESEVHWPGGGRSIYFRDPAGNCVELAVPRIWGFPEVE